MMKVLSNLVITRIVSCNHLLNSPVGTVVRRPPRKRWAVAFKAEGKTIYSANGRDVVSDNTHPVILPRGCQYSWICVQPGDCRIVEFEADGEAEDVFSFDIPDNTALTYAFDKMDNSMRGCKPYSQTDSFSVLYEILSLLLRSVDRDYVSSKKYEVLKPAYRYMTEKYFDEKITNDFLAGLCGISTVYFRKSFESAYGTAPIKYLHNLRIKKAKNILLSDYQSIEQVADSVGYASVYHFSKMFKKYTGVSPSEYAKASRK